MLHCSRAWLKYLGLNQKEVTKRMGIIQAAQSQIEAERSVF